jgi:Flp pilus assembly protein TadD
MIGAVRIRRAIPAALAAVSLLPVFSACRGRSEGARSTTPVPAPTTAAPAATATFVGREACANCHGEEEKRWKGSHHDLAMQEATPATVLGNFANATFTHFGVTTTFFRRDGKYFVRTDGPDGQLHEYPIAYTFGVEPLQQYLIPFPGGRLQALNVVWDSRPKKEGGQRWFHLYPKEEVGHADPLHWTGPYQNWNFMCSECHSTNVRKGWNPASKTYSTTWSELDVSCESCHGPGSAHVAWAEAALTGKGNPDDPDKRLAVVLRDPAKASWDIDPKTGLARRSVPRTSQAEIETCARCHARRSVVAAAYVYGQPLLQTHRPALLEEGLYFDDGQIRDEVYEYGSFLQSKMHASGVSCTDCHDPHGLKVKGGADRVCMSCHLAEKFDTPAHHHHAASSAGARCVGCHMPTRDYMVVHARHDHSFRIPRPDLSDALGTPNACTQCHAGKSNAWAAAAASKWWGVGVRATRSYGEIVHAGRQQLLGGPEGIAALAVAPAVPAIRRATAASMLDPAAAKSMEALARDLADPDPLVRHGAVLALDAVDPARRPPLAAPLLRDPVRTIRIDAARALAAVPPETLSPSDRADLDRALAEYVASLEVDADRAEAHAGLGALYAERGDAGKAEAEYREALGLVPALAAASANLADLYRALGREPEAEQVLRGALERSPSDAGLRHALGLALVRQKRLAEALVELRRAAELAPGRARYAYVYGVALDSAGQPDRAVEVLAKAQQQHPADREILQALVAFSAKAGKTSAAGEYGRKLAALDGRAGGS